MILDPRQYRRDPRKPAKSVKDLKCRTMTEQERYRSIIRNDKSLCDHIIVNQHTIILAKLVPTWNTFMQTPYFREMRLAVDDDAMMRKYRAWWDLISGIQRSRERLGYAYACLLVEAMRKRGTNPKDVNWEVFRISESVARETLELVKVGFNDLTMGS